MITIYMHTLPNGKSYVGQTSLPLSQRIGKDFSGYKNQTAFWDAIQEYGVENVETMVLHECEDLEESNRLEILSIEQYGTLVPNGYNSAKGGNGRISIPKVAVSLPPNLLKRVERLSESTGYSISRIVEESLYRSLTLIEKHFTKRAERYLDDD